MSLASTLQAHCHPLRAVLESLRRMASSFLHSSGLDEHSRVQKNPSFNLAMFGCRVIDFFLEI
jgi:hypothetical protein